MWLFVFGHANEIYMDKYLIYMEQTIMFTLVVAFHSKHKYLVHKVAFYWKQKENKILFLYEFVA
jgi:hypothetical protein